MYSYVVSVIPLSFYCTRTEFLCRAKQANHGVPSNRLKYVVQEIEGGKVLIVETSQIRYVIIFRARFFFTKYKFNVVVYF